MNAFYQYWKAYDDENEANNINKICWSTKSLSNNIVREAINGLVALVNKDAYSDVEIQELSDGIIFIPKHLKYRGIRITFLALEVCNKTSKQTLARELANLTREAVCLCLLPSTEISLWPLSGQPLQSGAGTVIPIYPVDIDVIASQRIELLELIQYKLYRRLVLDKPDAATQYDTRLYNEFNQTRNGSGGSIEHLETVITRQPDDIRTMVEHPLFSRVRTAIDVGRGCLLVGPSSSGKSILALQVGRAYMLAGNQVEYINLGSMAGFPPTLFSICFSEIQRDSSVLIIVDDLQSNPTVARYLLALASAARRSAINTPPIIMAISWIDFSREIASWFEDCLPTVIQPHQIRRQLTHHYGHNISEKDIELLVGTFGDDIFLLRLSLEQSSLKKAAVGPGEIAEYVWLKKLGTHELQESEIIRITLVAGSLGRFDILTPPAFLIHEASANEATLHQLVKSGFLRRYQSNYIIGHRSLCGLLTDWIEWKGGWKELDKCGGPRNISGVVHDYLRSLGSSLAVDSLRALHARAGFKERPQMNRRAAALVELWAAFNSMLERIEHQQSLDPIWGTAPSSAMFAITAFAEIGKTELANESIEFLRKHWVVDGGKIIVTTDGFSTKEDFDKIQEAMIAEDVNETYSQPGDAINIEQFHSTWLLGVLLCAESKVLKPKIPLDTLSNLVEKCQLASGAFYPERVPWCTARVLLGLAACGRTYETSDYVKRSVQWLLLERSEGGACYGGVWNSGTGSWNTTLEVTGMVLLALAAVGYDCSDERLLNARAYLLSQREQWTSPGKELDGALAIQAYLDTGGDWEEVASPAQYLSRWAKGTAFWQNATKTARDSLDQSCRVAQIASHLISIGWTAIRSDLPAFLDALKTPDHFRSKFSGIELINPVEQPLNQMLSTEKATEVDLELEILLKVDKIVLSDCSVVGAYRRFDERVRNQLKDWRTKIEGPLLKPNIARENYLIWAAPGSGKSFFIQQIALSFGDKIEYFEINLAKLSKDDFINNIQKVNSCTKPVLCLLDEIDSRAEETWPYEECFSHLDINLQEDRVAVFILIGSHAAGMEGMISSMEKRNKGKDLLDRVPINNRFEVPGLSLEDQIVVVATQVIEAAELRKQNIREIEKLALYYALKNKELRTPRQLREIAAKATFRMRESEDRMKYDDIFDRGDNRNQQFWAEHQDASMKLSNLYIRLDK